MLLVALAAIRFAMMGAESRAMGPPPRPPQGLAPCPSTPNCVSSLATEEEHYVEPLPMLGSPEEAIERVRRIADAMPGSGVAAVAPGYLRLEYRSPLLGFVDDLELWADPSEGRIELRSASRVGYSDLGVNRRRVEQIRERLAAEAPSGG